MTPNKAGRGRPKGTGLNDAAHLRAIAGLMAANPDLRPTTAIKTLGITDPSVIRRLRDKYSAAEAHLNAELGPRASVNAPTNAPAMPVAQIPEPAPSQARVVPLAAVKAERKTAPVVPRDLPTRSATVQTLPRPLRTEAIPRPSETELPSWMGVGLSVYVLSVEAQFAVVGTMFQWPPFAAVLRSQVAFTELAVALTSPVASSSRPQA
jgi:hypothetical protein